MCVVAEVRRVSPREKWSRKVVVSAAARRVIGREAVWAERPYAETRCWPAREAADKSESEEVEEAKDEQSIKETSAMWRCILAEAPGMVKVEILTDMSISVNVVATLPTELRALAAPTGYAC